MNEPWPLPPDGPCSDLCFFHINEIANIDCMIHNWTLAFAARRTQFSFYLCIHPHLPNSMLMRFQMTESLPSPPEGRCTVYHFHPQIYKWCVSQENLIQYVKIWLNAYIPPIYPVNTWTRPLGQPEWTNVYCNIFDQISSCWVQLLFCPHISLNTSRPYDCSLPILHLQNLVRSSTCVFSWKFSPNT